MKGIFKWTLMGLMLGGLSFNANAAAKSFNPTDYYFGLDLGFAFSQHNTTMTVDNGSGAPSPFNLDQYSTKNQRNTTLGLQIGKRWVHDQSIFPIIALGLRYQHFFESDIDGSVTQYSNPLYRNYSYQWPISTNIVSLNSKLNIVQFKQFLPYVSAGVGAAFNRSGDYEESPYTTITPRFSPDYASKNKSNFYYDLGLGVDMLLTPQWMISLGYNYQSIGDVISGFGRNGWESAKLGLGRFSTHAALLGLTYLS